MFFQLYVIQNGVLQKTEKKEEKHISQNDTILTIMNACQDLFDIQPSQQYVWCDLTETNFSEVNTLLNSCIVQSTFSNQFQFSIVRLRSLLVDRCTIADILEDDIRNLSYIDVSLKHFSPSYQKIKEKLGIYLRHISISLQELDSSNRRLFNSDISDIVSKDWGSIKIDTSIFPASLYSLIPGDNQTINTVNCIAINIQSPFTLVQSQKIYKTVVDNNDILEEKVGAGTSFISSMKYSVKTKQHNHFSVLNYMDNICSSEQIPFITYCESFPNESAPEYKYKIHTPLANKYFPGGEPYLNKETVLNIVQNITKEMKNIKKHTEQVTFYVEVDKFLSKSKSSFVTIIVDDIQSGMITISYQHNPQRKKRTIMESTFRKLMINGGQTYEKGVEIQLYNHEVAVTTKNKNRFKFISGKFKWHSINIPDECVHMLSQKKPFIRLIEEFTTIYCRISINNHNEVYFEYSSDNSSLHIPLYRHPIILQNVNNFLLSLDQTNAQVPIPSLTFKHTGTFDSLVKYNQKIDYSVHDIQATINRKLYTHFMCVPKIWYVENDPVTYSKNGKLFSGIIKSKIQDSYITNLNHKITLKNMTEPCIFENKSNHRVRIIYRNSESFKEDTIARLYTIWFLENGKTKEEIEKLFEMMIEKGILQNSVLSVLEVYREYSNNNSMSQFLKKYSLQTDNDITAQIEINYTNMSISIFNSLNPSIISTITHAFQDSIMGGNRLFSWDSILNTDRTVEFTEEYEEEKEDESDEVEPNEDKSDEDENNVEYDEALDLFFGSGYLKGGGKRKGLLSFLNENEPWFVEDQDQKQHNNPELHRTMSSAIVWQDHYPLLLTSSQFDLVKEDFRNFYLENKDVSVDIIDACYQSQQNSIGTNADVRKLCMSLVFGPQKNRYVCPYSSKLLSVIDQKLDLPTYVIEKFQRFIAAKKDTIFIGFPIQRQMPACFKKPNNNNKNTFSTWVHQKKIQFSEKDTYNPYFREWSKSIDVNLKCGQLPPNFYALFTESVQKQMSRNIVLISRNSEHTIFLRLNIGNGVHVQSFFESMLHIVNYGRTDDKIRMEIFMRTLIRNSDQTFLLDGTIDRYFPSNVHISSFQNFIEYILSKSIRKKYLICWDLIQNSEFFKDTDIIILNYSESKKSFSIPCEILTKLRGSKKSKICYILRFTRDGVEKFQPIVFVDSKKYTTIQSLSHQAFQATFSKSSDFVPFKELYNLILVKTEQSQECLQMSNTKMDPETYVLRYSNNNSVLLTLQKLDFDFEMDVIDVYHKVVAKMFNHKRIFKRIIIPVQPQIITPKNRRVYIDDVDKTLLMNAFDTCKYLQIISQTIDHCKPLFIHSKNKKMYTSLTTKTMLTLPIQNTLKIPGLEFSLAEKNIDWHSLSKKNISQRGDTQTFIVTEPATIATLFDIIGKLKSYEITLQLYEDTDCDFIQVKTKKNYLWLDVQKISIEDRLHYKLESTKTIPVTTIDASKISSMYINLYRKSNYIIPCQPTRLVMDGKYKKWSGIIIETGNHISISPEKQKSVYFKSENGKYLFEELHYVELQQFIENNNKYSILPSSKIQTQYQSFCSKFVKSLDYIYCTELITQWLQIPLTTTNTFSLVYNLLRDKSSAVDRLNKKDDYYLKQLCVEIINNPTVLYSYLHTKCPNELIISSLEVLQLQMDIFESQMKQLLYRDIQTYEYTIPTNRFSSKAQSVI